MGIFDIFKKKEIKKTKQVSAFMQSGNTQSSGSPVNLNKYTVETYMKNIIAYRCIDARAKSFSSVPWKVYKNNIDSEPEIQEHSFNQIFEKPNPQEGWGKFAYKELAFRLMNGNSFTLGVNTTKSLKPETVKEMYVLRPDRMDLITSNNLVTGYKYQRDSEKAIIYPVDPVTQKSVIMHIYLFNPANDFWGMSPIQPASYVLDSHNYATEWNTRMMQNEGRPGMMLFFEGQLTDEQYDRIEQQLRSETNGSDNAGKALILEGMKVDAKPYNWTPKEMDWLETNRETARNICLAFGVPPLLINIPGDSTYSNYKEARLAFWEDTVIPDLNYYKTELNNWLFYDTDLYPNYDLNNVSALSVKRDQLWERAQNADFITDNEKRAMVGYPPVEGGDVLYKPASMIPIDAEVDFGNSPNEKEEEEKQIKKLIDSGHSRNEALNILGLPQSNDKH